MPTMRELLAQWGHVQSQPDFPSSLSLCHTLFWSVAPFESLAPVWFRSFPHSAKLLVALSTPCGTGQSRRTQASSPGSWLCWSGCMELLSSRNQRNLISLFSQSDLCWQVH